MVPRAGLDAMEQSVNRFPTQNFVNILYVLTATRNDILWLMRKAHVRLGS
jgi:hypothetical protein